MKLKTVASLTIIMLASILLWTSAEEIQVDCYVLDNGYCLERFIDDPSEEYLQANSSHTFSVVFDLDKTWTQTGEHSYEYRLIKWLHDANDINLPTQSTSIKMVMPVFLPSFLWIKADNRPNTFIACELSANTEQWATANIAAYTRESFLCNYYGCKKQTSVFLDPDNDVVADGIQYTDITMVPVSRILQQKGCELVWNEHKDQLSLAYNGSHHILAFDKGQLFSIDDTELQSLSSTLLGGRRYYWIDGEDILWMDVDSARSLWNLIAQ